LNDDGTAAGIRIPSMIISQIDGKKLMDYENDEIVILANFDMFRPDNHVEYDIWYSSSNDKALDFI
jgi:hypothetical protein